VRYILEGSVRRLGEQVEVNVQLIDAQSGAHVWADRFNTDRANLAEAQEEIVGRLAHTLDVTLAKAAGSQVDQENNPDARDLIMRGWAFFYRPMTTANWEQAEQAFQKALELDPQSIGARIGIATLLAQRITRYGSKSRDQDLARAEKLALEAAQRDPNSTQAYTALGNIHRLQNRWPQSRIELEKAIALDRNNASAILQLGITLLYSGEPEAALPHLEQALRLSPASDNIHFFYAWLGYDHLLMSHAHRAAEFLRKACAAAPQHPPYRLTLASALGLSGDIDEAKNELAEAVKLKPEYSPMTKLLSSPEARVGTPKYFTMRKATYEVGLLRAGMPAD
jgi:tetratricopeptide (TPR) repeat protein